MINKLLVNSFLYQDLIGLSQLVGATESNHKGSHNTDLDRLASIIRKAIYLLQYRQSEGKGCRFREASRFCSFDRQKLIRIPATNSIGLVHYELKDLKNSLVSLDETDQTSMKNQLVFYRNQLDDSENIDNDDNTLIDILKSSWFMEFVSVSLDVTYPIDRFTILVAIWIIAVECKHSTLIQLLSELVDWLAHDEATSCGVEDLMQLGRLGSIWLTKYKRYEVTILQNPQSNDGGIGSSRLASVYHDEYQDKEIVVDDDDDYDDQISGSQSDVESSEVENESITNVTASLKVNTDNCVIDSKRKLRNLLDRELISGSDCRFCSHHSSRGLFATLEDVACDNCSSQLSSEHCSLSFRPLPMVKLQSLSGFRPQLESIIFVSPAQWVRMILGARTSLDESRRVQDTGERQLQDHEQLDISENFQRLTVVRNSTQTHSEDQDSSEDDNEPEEDEEEEEDKEPDTKDTTEKRHSVFEELSHFLSLKLESQAQRYQGPTSSESVDFLRSTRPDSKVVAVNSGEILVLESVASLEDLLSESNLCRIGLLTSNEWRQFGSIVACLSRSSVSQLQLGCGRLFTSLELIKIAPEGRLDEPECPFCGLELSALQSFNKLAETLIGK